MLHTENKARRVLCYAMVAVLMLAFALSFFSCIKETFIPWFPERLDDPSERVELLPMLPGFIRYLLIPAAALLLIGKLWTDILSIVFLIPPLLVALGMKIIYEVFETMGGLGGYVHEYTPLGRIVQGLLLLGYAGEMILLCTRKNIRCCDCCIQSET